MINLLQKDGRMPIVSLAKKLNISETTARSRLKHLIDSKIIKIVAVSNPIELGFEIIGSLKLSVDLKKKDQIMEELKKIDALSYIALTTGGTDIDVEFVARCPQTGKNDGHCEVNPTPLPSFWVNYDVLGTDYTSFAVVHSCSTAFWNFWKQEVVWILNRSP